MEVVRAQFARKAREQLRSAGPSRADFAAPPAARIDFEPQPETVVAERSREALAPFAQHDGAGRVRLRDPELDQGGNIFDAVEIQVQERHPAGQFVDQIERGAGDPDLAGHPEAAGDRARQKRLARAEVTLEHDQIPGADTRGEPATKAPGVAAIVQW
jgi:hypothetical protein